MTVLVANRTFPPGYNRSKITHHYIGNEDYIFFKNGGRVNIELIDKNFYFIPVAQIE